MASDSSEQDRFGVAESDIALRNFHTPPSPRSQSDARLYEIQQSSHGSGANHVHEDPAPSRHTVRCASSRHFMHNAVRIGLLIRCLR